MKNFIVIILLVFFSLPIFFTGCNESDCPIGSANDLKIRFVSQEDGTIFSIDTVTVTAEGTDSVLVNREINATYLTLPLNGTADSTVYVFHFTQVNRETVEGPYIDENGDEQYGEHIEETAVTKSDKVIVRYKAEKKFVSMDCGLVYTFVLSDGAYTSNMIKSMGIVNTEIKEANEENIYMFF